MKSSCSAQCLLASFVASAVISVTENINNYVGEDKLAAKLRFRFSLA